MPAVGISLGTKNCCIGVFQLGKLEIIANKESNYLTPSYVAFTDSGPLFGEAAKNQTIKNMKSTVFDVKRLIGREYDEQLIKNHWPFRVIDDCGKPKICVELKNKQQKFSPKEITSIILRKLKQTAEGHLGTSIKDAVITVPAYFNDSQRQATKDACFIAGFNVLNITSEPVAATVAHSFEKKLESVCNALIFDLGGSSFDVSIVTIHAHAIFEVKATVCDHSLGGEYFDDILTNYLADEFQRKHKQDLRVSPSAFFRLRIAAEKAKCTLSSDDVATIELKALFKGIDYHAKLQRKQFENFCTKVAFQLFRLVEKVLNVANMRKEQVHDIVLVGGSARIPKLRSLLESHFEDGGLKFVGQKLQNWLQSFYNGNSVNCTWNPEEAIARGAAIHAAILSGYKSSRLQELLMVDNTDDLGFFRGNANIIILACKENKLAILEYLLSKKIDISPNDTDECGHNAFYYAIRSGNVELLDTLINKWPVNYFATHSKELDELLSESYEQLKLVNVPLSVEVQFFVETELINLRFYANTSSQIKGAKMTHVDKIKARIELVIENIGSLITQFSNSTEIEEHFLFAISFIAQNLHVLKRQLKSTYVRLPWEELEFCLIIFITSHKKHQEANLFYHTILNKNKILNYLEHFAKRLQDEKDFIRFKSIDKLAELPKLQREKVVADIVSSYPQFKVLYADHQEMRDIHSLEKMKAYIQPTISADPAEREGKLILTRSLQVLGEYLKNTLEAPKLSSLTSERLLLTLPRNTRSIVIGLRNSLSHSYSLSKRTTFEENSNVKFFIGVQKDLKKIANVANEILFTYKIEKAKLILKKMIDSSGAAEMKEVAGLLKNIDFDDWKNNGFETMNHIRLENIFQELTTIITDKTDSEKQYFKKIEKIIDAAKHKCQNLQWDCLLLILKLKSICSQVTDFEMDHNSVRIMKYSANKTLENITSKIENDDLREMAKMTCWISQSATRSMKDEGYESLDKVLKLTSEVFSIVAFETGDLKWIEGLRNKLNGKGFAMSVEKKKNVFNFTKDYYEKLLELKLSELKSIFTENDLNEDLIKKVSFYKTNKKLQAVVEMLVLDIMSLLEKNLENNLLFLDEKTPLLTGKCLRNHLAHDNILLDILPSNPTIGIIANAIKFISEATFMKKQKIGKMIIDDPSQVRANYMKGFEATENQQKMFDALESGNVDVMKSCIRKGADIKGRNTNALTALHFAARGPGLKIIKFLFAQKLEVNVKDLNGQSPLHFAAASGKKHIVDFLIREAGMCVDDEDFLGRTPLHRAAERGHKDTVEILMEHKAKTDTKDMRGFSPLHYAVKNNRIVVAKFMLQKEENVDINETLGGYTSLHIAAESGFLDLVRYLIKNEANVNAKNDNGGIPLHTTALNGHLEVVKVLIKNGSDVNSRNQTGCTSLHYAIETGNGEVADILLKHGADVNAVDKAYNNTPLHYAAGDGHGAIVESLLKYKARVNVATKDGLTPLHLASQNGHLNIVAVLLKSAANVFAKDKRNQTPLHLASWSGNTEVAELLLKNRAEINSRNDEKYTPLHVAAFMRQKDICKLLIKNKANIRAQDKKGRVPLHEAASSGCPEIINLLISNKAEVDARDHKGFTPLNVAAANGQREAVDSLIKWKAEVNAKAFHAGLTPLFSAVFNGHTEVVELLIKNNAKVREVNAQLLYFAIDKGHKQIVEILLANGADANSKSERPLISAIQENHKDIVEILIANRANVNADDGAPLECAVHAGFKDIVELLIKNNAQVNIKAKNNFMPLHLAAFRGHKDIAGILIANGAEINAFNIHGLTPLLGAAWEGHDDVVELLIENGADVEVANDKCPPLHTAVIAGHVDVVEVLLSNGAEVNAKDEKNRTPLELAVANEHVEIMKMILQYKKPNWDAKGNDGLTILHIASQTSNLQIVKYLVDEGCNINARNRFGSKPIHIAAREGFTEAVEFFLSKGLSVDELGEVNKTLLHYAVMKGKLDALKFLIEKGADVNAKDDTGETPLHYAAAFGFKNVIVALLESGAILSTTNYFSWTALDVAAHNAERDVHDLLAKTVKLFESAKNGRYSEIADSIDAGAIINAKYSHGGWTPLYLAIRNGSEQNVKILLQHKANPNVSDWMGFTPLHMAAYYSELTIAKILLSQGAVYKAVGADGKTPYDLARNDDIKRLLQLINDLFKKAKDGDVKLIAELKKIKDRNTLKSVLNAQNNDNRTLIVTAIHSDFPKIKQLKEISQSDVCDLIEAGLLLMSRSVFQGALGCFESALEKRMELLGSDSPGTWEIRFHMAKALYRLGKYENASNILEEDFEKQKNILGSNHEDALKTSSFKALVLHRQGKNKEAYHIYKNVYPKQKLMLGPNNSETLDTHFCMALVLDALGRYEEALEINTSVFYEWKKTKGTYDPGTVMAQNNIAMVLSNQGKFEEALEMYREVYGKKQIIFGANSVETIRTLHLIGNVLMRQEKIHKALETFQEVLSKQKKVLQPNHPETLLTQYNIAGILFKQGKHIGAFKAYNACFSQIKSAFGPDHPAVIDSVLHLKILKEVLKHKGYDTVEDLQNLQDEIFIDASKGDVQAVALSLKNGTTPDCKDMEGRTPLHYASDGGHIYVVSILLQYGADVTLANSEGYTSLHAASAKGHKNIVEALLEHVGRYPLKEFLNLKNPLNGATALHEAAKFGHHEVVLCLLKHGAIYSLENDEGKTAIDFCKNQKIKKLLTFIEKAFSEFKTGNEEVLSSLDALTPFEFLAATNARNKQEKTLLQIAIANGHKEVASKLLELLKADVKKS